MTGWLTRTFVRDHEKTGSPQVRTRYGRMASGVGLGLNIALWALKLLAGQLSGSVSITADALNNLSDASSSLVSLLGFKLAAKPADEEHPYGHGRYEYLAALTVAVIIMIIGFELFKSSLEKVLSPTPVRFSWLNMGILAAAMLAKGWMLRFYGQIGRRIDSDTLIAAAADSRNDVITTGAVLLAALISRFAGLELDGWMGLAVSLFILWSGFGLIKDTLDPLLGRAPDPRLVQEIRDRIMAYPDVLGTHDLLVHDYGPGRRFASVHVEMAAEGDVLHNHDVIDNIERDFLRDSHMHLIVHLDPIVTQDPLVRDLRGWLSGAVTRIDPGLSIHDLRVVKGKSHTNVIFDCLRPAGLNMSDAQLKRALGELLRTRDPKYYAVVTLDDSYAALPADPVPRRKEQA